MKPRRPRKLKKKMKRHIERSFDVMLLGMQNEIDKVTKVKFHCMPPRSIESMITQYNRENHNSSFMAYYKICIEDLDEGLKKLYPKKS